MGASRTTTTTARITEADSARLTAVAEVTGRSVSDIVNQVIHDYLEALDMEALIDQWDQYQRARSERLRTLLKGDR